MSKIQVLFHSSIRIEGEKTVYFDPYKISGEPCDGDVIFVTHDHFDHFSPEDIEKVMKEDTVLVVPENMRKKAEKVISGDRLVCVKEGDSFQVCGLAAEAVAAYNTGSLFHPKKDGWTGYVVTIDGQRCYVAGDTDENPDNLKVKCDVALVPAGGKYTMNAEQAAAFVNKLRPKLAIPTHYGSVAGSPQDGERFKALVDKDIAVELQLKF